jgi:uncharacterized protein (DUF362 family)
MKTGKGNIEANLSRRDFIRKSSMGILGVSLAIKPFPVFLNLTNRVVIVRHRNVFDSEGHVREKPVFDMVNKGITELAGSVSLSGAWSRFFTPGDIIGMKVNAISFRGLANTPLASHYPALMHAIIKSCESAGVEDKQFVIWDRSEAELVNLGFRPVNEPDRPRVLGTYKHHRGSDGIGFHPKQHPVGKKTSRVSRILSDVCTALINVPVIKPHTLAGMTASLKNHYGTIDNPSAYHLGACTDPGIPEINAIPVIRDKQRLVICNALQAVYRGGISWKPANAWPYGGIILGTDPVSVDRVCLKILNEKRLESGKNPIDKRARHIRLAAELGIGVEKIDEIELVEIELA